MCPLATLGAALATLLTVVAPRGPPFARVAFTGVVACGPGVATWGTVSPLASIRQVPPPSPPFPPPSPAVRPCHVHGRKWWLSRRRGRRSRLAAIRQVKLAVRHHNLHAFPCRLLVTRPVAIIRFSKGRLTCYAFAFQSDLQGRSQCCSYCSSEALGPCMVSDARLMARRTCTVVQDSQDGARWFQIAHACTD